MSFYMLQARIYLYINGKYLKNILNKKTTVCQASLVLLHVKAAFNLEQPSLDST